MSLVSRCFAAEPLRTSANLHGFGGICPGRRHSNEYLLSFALVFKYGNLDVQYLTLGCLCFSSICTTLGHLEKQSHLLVLVLMYEHSDCPRHRSVREIARQQVLVISGLIRDPIPRDLQGLWSASTL